MSGTEHFIPLTRADAQRLALEQCPPEARAGLADVGTLLSSLLHVELHQRLERLKELYAPLDPDADTRRPDSLPAPSPAECAHRLSETLADVLRRANYVQLARDELDAALEQDSPFQLRVHVELDDFAELLVFTRGKRLDRVEKRRWGRKRIHAMDVFERVVVLARVKEAPELPEGRREGLPVGPGRTLVKLFRNVPAADLEMVLPNVQVRMRARDRALLGVPAVVGGVILLVTKLSASLLLTGALIGFWLGLRHEEVQLGAKELLGLGLALVALATFLLRQFSAFKNRKIAFMKALADNLYFRSLDHGAGVFHRLIDEAEEQDGKEAFLAYVALLQRPGLTEAELDAHVEEWLAAWCGTRIDFEADDALAKLERFELLRRDGERLSVVPVEAARVALDQRWDDWFLFANEARS
ncbi:MAG TPA: TMEM143 family protein [Planctomycetota bacterium]|nr:TMEM143 family protein [Planctomycetota bacterium]